MTLDEFEKLVAAATPGPWDVDYSEDAVRDQYGHLFAQLGRDEENFQHCDDAQFIAASRDMAPHLIAIARAAQNEALRWNESYCTREDCQQMTDAWAVLDAALAALEAP